MSIFESLTDQHDPDKIRIEMEKRYDGSVLLIQNLKDKTEYLMRYCGYLDKNECVFTNYEFDSNVAIPFDSMDYNISVYNPKIGLYEVNFDTHNVVMYFNRSPYRQWSRGINPKNSQLVPILSTLPLNMNIRKNYIQNYYNVLLTPKERKLKTALAVAEKLGESVINIEFAVTLHPVKQDAFLLWYHDCVIGEVIPSEYRVNVLNLVFSQEVLDSISLFDGYDIVMVDKTT